MSGDIPFALKAKSFSHIIGVVLLQDMRSRFNTGSYFGYIIAIGWPLFHLLVLTLSYLLRTSIAPMGDSPTIFIATGTIPYILCFYPARLMAISLLENRQLLNIPLIKPIHLMVSRALLEMLNAMIVLFIFAVGALLLGVEILPEDHITAFSAVMASVFLGAGIGFFNTSMMAVFGMFYMVAFVMAFVALYISAGVYIPVDMFPEDWREIARYNPLEIIVEWMRSAYFTNLDVDNASKFLVIFVAGVFLALGVAGERFLRGKF